MTWHTDLGIETTPAGLGLGRGTWGAHLFIAGATLARPRRQVQDEEMTDRPPYEILEMGALDEWRSHFGGFRPESSRDGRRVVDHEIHMQYIGMTANAFEPGEEAGYWHSHSELEELYVFLTGRGEMGLDDAVVPVGPGTVVRVGQGVMRSWRAAVDTPEPLWWLCIRAGGGVLDRLPSDSVRDNERGWLEG